MISSQDAVGSGGKTEGAQGGRPSPIELEVMTSIGGFARLASEWGRLFELAHNPAPPLHHDWLSLWLEIYGPKYMDGREPLRVLCFRRDGELVGVLPLYLRRPARMADGGTSLMFVSTGEAEDEEICPDYMDLLCLEEVKARCAEMTWRYISCDLEIGRAHV